MIHSHNMLYYHYFIACFASFERYGQKFSQIVSWWSPGTFYKTWPARACWAFGHGGFAFWIFFLAMMGWGTLIRINSTVNHLVLLLLFNCVGQNLLPSVEQTARPRGVMTNYYLFQSTRWKVIYLVIESIWNLLKAFSHTCLTEQWILLDEQNINQLWYSPKTFFL